MIERRSVLKVLAGLVAAPGIVKVASLMPVKASLQPTSQVDVLFGSMRLRPEWAMEDLKRRFQESIEWRTKELAEQMADAVFAQGTQWSESNLFLKNIDDQYYEQFGAEGAKVGDTLRIRLPGDFTVAQTHRLDMSIIPQMRPVIPDTLALAAAAVAAAPAVLKTPVTRRFWSKSK